MARVPAFARAFAGRWRIVEMDVWENDVIDEVEEAHITFGPGAHGEIAFIAVSGDLDVAAVPETDRLAPSSPAGLR